MLFGGHETFHIRDGWLHKGLGASHKDPMVFADPFATDVLGVGRNMVKAIRYWMVAAGLAEEASVSDGEGRRKPQVSLSPVGKTILRKDPYFEEEMTLWLLHYHLATNKRRATAWYWAFNEFPMTNFDSKAFVTYLSRWTSVENPKKVTKVETLAKDFNCLIRTYTAERLSSRKLTPEDVFECPLASLRLIDAFQSAGNFRINVNNRAIPEPVFAFSILDFMRKNDVEGSHIGFKELSSRPGSPGRVFALNADGVLENLSRIESKYGKKNFAFSRTAGLNSLKVKAQPLIALLNDGYQGLGK